MKLNTKYFGTVDYEKEDLITFPAGLFGFEEERGFLLLPFEGSGGNMLCLQSAATPALAFVVMNPFSLTHDYEPVLQKRELRFFGAKESSELAYYVLCAVRNPVSESTVNLKCPVVVNPHTREARQIILEEGDYNMRHPLREFSSKGDEGGC
ncbi:MAG: flagellar assembly protein FliW [Clostridia bacterium]|nr:flagellar assembly protein FliW [Clostridia bacterium]MBQ3076352.1 flagellar assembly protein FliW [Clostridia bacterium]